MSDVTPPPGDDDPSSSTPPPEGADLPKPGEHSTWAVSLPEAPDEPVEPTAAFEPDSEPEPFVPPPQPPLVEPEPVVAEPEPDPRPPPPESAARPDPADVVPPPVDPTPGYGPPTGYGQPSVYGPAGGFGGAAAYGPAPQVDSQASASLVVGVMALPFMLCCGPIGIVLGVVALGLGINSIRQIDASHGMLTGREQAIAGTILGAIAVVGTIAMFVLPQVLFRFF